MNTPDQGGGNRNQRHTEKGQIINSNLKKEKKKAKGQKRRKTRHWGEKSRPKPDGKPRRRDKAKRKKNHRKDVKTKTVSGTKSKIQSRGTKQRGKQLEKM